MNSFEEKLSKYAELAVKVALNIQKGQPLVIEAPLEIAYFVRRIADKAYEAGAKNVHVEWNDDQMHRIKLEKAPFETLTEFPLGKAEALERMAKEGAAYLMLFSNNVDLLQGISPDRIAASTAAYEGATQQFRRHLQNGDISWSALAVATGAWAAKVFPDVDEAAAVGMLWDHIFTFTRADCDDPVGAWRDHIQGLMEKLTFLNDKNYKSLRFVGPGTDVTMDLPKNHRWIGGGVTTKEGVFFVPDMPTEEVFTVPHKYGVNGTVTATKTCNCGSVVDHFTLTFKQGRIVDFTAEKGYETLKNLIGTDEGSHYLGEVALVPRHSLLAGNTIEFYNNLIDENSRNHIAIGAAYSFSIQDGPTMTKEALEAAGVNLSMVHADIIIGSPDMQVYGETQDGVVEEILI